jgi:hypothetical protein
MTAILKGRKRDWADGRSGGRLAWATFAFGSSVALLLTLLLAAPGGWACSHLEPEYELIAQNQAGQGFSPPLAGSGVDDSEIRATTRADAVQQAKANAGRANPFERIQGFKPFPSNAPVKVPKKEAKKLPPPSFAPPPPPNTTVNGGAAPALLQEDLLSASELPAPPEKPSLLAKMQLLGIVGDHAIFKISDPSLRRENGWPKSLTLAAGDHFETVSVVAVTPDAVTLEEDGDRQIKQLPRLK